MFVVYCTNPNENLFKNKNQKHPQECRGVNTFTVYMLRKRKYIEYIVYINIVS
jgi:hypothetical protein